MDSRTIASFNDRQPCKFESISPFMYILLQDKCITCLSDNGDVEHQVVEVKRTELGNMSDLVLPKKMGELFSQMYTMIGTQMLKEKQSSAAQQVAFFTNEQDCIAIMYWPVIF